ncbi:MAG: hypothetical protein LQ349_000206 [Xanthoria aureola]|nr:MAG: hypothetical protein LQ349_000206 [Xanthoria aureola]
MPFNPFKSSSSTSKQDTIFPSPSITYALPAVILKRHHPITLADITAADIEKYLTGFHGLEASNHWSWISGSFSFEEIHDALSSFSSQSLPGHTKKSLEAFVKQQQTKESKIPDLIYKKHGQGPRDAFVKGKREAQESYVERLEFFINKRVKASQPVEDD